jgi:hypothetical protein
MIPTLFYEQFYDISIPYTPYAFIRAILKISTQICVNSNLIMERKPSYLCLILERCHLSSDI